MPMLIYLLEAKVFVGMKMITLK